MAHPALDHSFSQWRAGSARNLEQHWRIIIWSCSHDRMPAARPWCSLTITVGSRRETILLETVGQITMGEEAPWTALCVCVCVGVLFDFCGPVVWLEPLPLDERSFSRVFLPLSATGSLRRSPLWGPQPHTLLCLRMVLSQAGGRREQGSHCCHVRHVQRSRVGPCAARDDRPRNMGRALHEAQRTCRYIRTREHVERCEG